MKIGVVVPSLNERDWLVRTIRSIRETTPPGTEIVHVDDASSPPEPDLSRWDVRQLRLPERFGAARARAYGMFHLESDWDVAFTCDAHCLYGEGEAVAELLAEQQKGLNSGARSPDHRHSEWELAVHMEPNKIERTCKLALDHHGLSYCGPARQGCATVYYQDSGMLRVRFHGVPRRDTDAESTEPHQHTAGIFGGNYAMERTAFERMGGYPQLPGHFGFEEEFLSLVACAHKIPIVCASLISPWHQFRGQGWLNKEGRVVDVVHAPYQTTEDMQLLNLAAVYRLCFSERMWQERWRPLLKTRLLDGRHLTVPERVLRDCERPEVTAYRDALQENFVLRDEELLGELDRRIALDNHKEEK